MQAEFETDAGDVKQRVRQVQAKLDEVARRLADLAKGLESLRLYTGGRAAPSGRPPASAGLPDTLALRPSLVSDDQGLYDLASEDMKAGNYPLAISEFSQLLENFPQGSLADKARYWLGECYYAQKDFPRAIEAFQRVMTDYPNSEKVPAALFYLGDSLLRVNDRANGLPRLRALIKDFPDSEEANRARKLLKDLGAAASRPGGTTRRR
jgi:tol-pal system protein YbgF